ncbi:MAG: histidine kinase [Treponema sp.]|nr:histidine kinase [Treponema sp.]
MRLVGKKLWLVLLAALFLSCVDYDKLNIQSLVKQWTEITDFSPDIVSVASGADLASPDLISLIDAFSLSLERFQDSDLLRTYGTIPFSLTERSFGPFIPITIQEVTVISDLVSVFRSSIVLGDTDRAQATSAEISNLLIGLLIIDGEAQRYISSSYLQLFITLIIFILIIALLVLFLNRSLTRTLKREADTMIFSHSYMLAQDEERARISRELHDTVIQDMRYLLLETEKIGNTGEKNKREELTAQTVPMMADIIRKTRDICSELIPPDFRFSELPDALRQLCLGFGKKTGIDCRAEIDSNLRLDFIAMEKRLQIYRIVQEALSNIEKHSGAKEAIVTMRLGQNGAVFIGIGDDGKGFISPLDNNGQIISGIDRSHIGIISMKERAAILGGRLKIITEPGEGALVCLEFPSTPPTNPAL